MANEASPKVLYHRLGKSGLRVSNPIIGAMSFGSDKWQKWVKNEDEAIPLLKAAWDRGVNTIDTANGYSNGESERIIGKFIKQHNIPRSKILIFTKCFGFVHADLNVRGAEHPELKDERDYVNHSGLSRHAIFKQVDASLERLGTTYIDLLQIHRFDPNTPQEETMRALHDLVQWGKVRYIGASSMRTYQFSEYQHIADLNGWTKFISMQNEYSLLYREEEREMIPYCNAHGIGLIPWGPLHGGDLAKPLEADSSRRSTRPKIVSAADKEIISRVGEIAKKKGWTQTQVALAWVNKRVSVPIVGVSSAERLEGAIVNDTLTDEEEKYLEEPYVPRAVKGHA